MSGAYIPVDPYDRARLMRLAQARIRAARMRTLAQHPSAPGW